MGSHDHYDSDGMEDDKVDDEDQQHRDRQRDLKVGARAHLQQFPQGGASVQPSGPKAAAPAPAGTGMDEALHASPPPRPHQMVPFESETRARGPPATQGEPMQQRNVAKLFQCSICKARTQDVKWFVEEYRTDRQSGSIIIFCHGLVCWVCGVALEAWPLESATLEGQQKLIQRILEDPDFNKLFQKARQGAERVVVRTLQQQQVSSGCEMGVYAKITGAFIAWDVFSNHFKQPPNSIANVPIIKIAHPFLPGSSEDTWVTGALLSLKHIPSTLEYLPVEFFAKTYINFNHTELDASELLREGHAQEYFKHSATKSLSAHVASRECAKKNGFTLLTAAEVSQEVALTQAGRENAEPTGAGQAQGQFSSGSRLSLMAGNTESSSVGKVAAPAVAGKRRFGKAVAAPGVAQALPRSAPPLIVTPKKIPAGPPWGRNVRPRLR